MKLTRLPICEPRRRGETRAQISLPIAPGYGVHCQRQNIEVGFLGPGDHGVVQRTVFVEIELKRLRRFEHAADLFDAHGAARRQAEHRAKFFRGPRNHASPSW